MTSPIPLEVFRSRFQAVVDEVATVILHTGHTVFVKETADFGAALVSTGGEVFAVPTEIGVASMVGRPMRDALKALPDLDEGDIVIANDPAATRGLSTHLNDLFAWKPIFLEGELLCYCLTFVHASDVGGRVPGSVAPSNTTIFEEGHRIPPVRLFRRGALDDDVLRLILLNTRTPDGNWGDIKALIAAVNLAEQRMLKVVRRYGIRQCSEAIEGLLDQAETEARQIIDELPDGTYAFGDYVERPGEDFLPMYLHLTLTVKGSDLLLDFTGSDPEVEAAYNMPTFEQRGHWGVVRGIVDYFRTMRADITHNSGLVRPVAIRTPRGSLLNPTQDKACGVRAALIGRIYSITAAALVQCRPDAIPAAGAGQATIVLVSVQDANGLVRMSVVQPLTGGSGARPFGDGVDGADTMSGYLRNIPTESVEHEIPIVVTRYGLRPGSGGAGRFRGGLGVVLSFRLLAPSAVVTARGMDRQSFQPWGVNGGRPGAAGHAILNPSGPEPKPLGSIDVLDLQFGEELLLEAPGGGGYGPPTDRPIDAVEQDVRLGLVKPDQAVSEYGVIRRGTEYLRNGPAPTNFLAHDGVDKGDFRLAYESLWPEPLRIRFNQMLYANGLDPKSRRTILTLVAEHIRLREPITDDLLQQLLQTVRGESLELVSDPPALDPPG